MLPIQKLTTADPAFYQKLKNAQRWDDSVDESISLAVKKILLDVKNSGDAALLAYTQKFDELSCNSVVRLEVSKAELAAALDSLSAEVRNALYSAAERIKIFHQKQLESAGEFEFTDVYGNNLGQKVRPLARVGIYVPGGKASYPSSVLMNAIPAKVAGVAEVVMVVPTPRGERQSAVLAAAAIAGVDTVYTIGGAQAVAALAYGTVSITRVDKIVGPGNAYVAEAKRQVFGQVGIDMIAGPSEILVIADGSVNADWVAMDLFSQAEHDELAQAILLCPDDAYLDAVMAAMNRLIRDLPRHAIIRTSIQNRGLFIKVKDLDDACAVANLIAPEHLELAVGFPVRASQAQSSNDTDINAEASKWAAKIHNAGAIFVGAYASEALGDYCAGPNHVLPTAGSARFSSPLSVYDFLKRTSVIKVSAEGARHLGVIAGTLGDVEGLHAHAKSARLRIS